MKKIYLLVLLLACSLGYLQAQGWYVYDGSAVPDQLTGWGASSSHPGPNMVEDVIDDPYIPGNKYFRYLQPDELRTDLSGSASKYYKLSDSWASNAVTVVTRVKGVQVDSLSGEYAFQIEIGDGVVRSVFDIVPDDSTLKEEKGDGGTVKVNANFNEWQVFRITLLDDSLKVYLNEDATPVFLSKNDANTTNQTRFGDAGSHRVAGLMDWYIIDTTGAYAPGAGAAIPDSLSTASGPQVGNFPGAGYDLAFASKQSIKDTNGYYADSMFVVDLKDAGFNVTVVDYESSTLSADFKAAVEGSDVVVIGRTPSSNDLAANKDYWNKLQLPIVSMSTYGAPKMGWVPSSVSKVLGQVYGTQQGHVEVPGDTIFKDISVPGSGNIDFSQDFLSFDVLTPTDMASITGQVLITMVNGVQAYNWNRQTDPANVDTVQFGDYDGYPLMIRWDPHVNDSMYTGSAGEAARAFHYRTLMPGGDDHYGWKNPATGTDEKVNGMYYFTPTMKAVFVNECAYLAGLQGLSISDNNDLDTLYGSVGTLSPDFSAGVTSYKLTVPKGTTSVTITATASDATATVEGAGEVSTLPYSDTITVTSEAGTPKEYVVYIMEEVAPVVGGVVPPGVGTLDDAIANASDGDTLYLKNDSTYYPISTLPIDKHLVIRAVEYPSLPGLDKLPHVVNLFGNTDMILMQDGGNLELIGVDMDGESGSATKIISLRTKKAHFSIYINRCRLHDVAGDLIGGNKSDTAYVDNFYIRNSFLYNTVEHGAYIKDVWVQDGVTNSVYKWEDLTFWNLGQQLEWFQNYSEGTSETYTVDHCTGYNLGTNTSSYKELIGNTDGISGMPIVYNITLSNSIFSNQLATNDQPSLMFSTTSDGGTNSITLKNLVLYQVKAPQVRPGSADIPIANQLSDDPQFADPDNGDFTIGNTAYLTAGDNSSIVGARYWAPDYVDNFCDVDPNCGVESIDVTKADLSVSAYPNPFNAEVSFEVKLTKAENVSIAIYDVSGRLVKQVNQDLTAGAHQININTNDVQPGAYFFKVKAGDYTSSGQLLKTE